MPYKVYKNYLDTQANEDNKPYNRKLKPEKQEIPDESSKQAENKDLKDEEDTDLQSQTRVNQNASDMDESQAQQMSTSKSQELVVYKHHDKNELLGFHEKLKLALIGATAIVVVLLLLVFSKPLTFIYNFNFIIFVFLIEFYIKFHLSPSLNLTILEVKT